MSCVKSHKIFTDSRESGNDVWMTATHLTSEKSMISSGITQDVCVRALVIMHVGSTKSGDNTMCGTMRREPQASVRTEVQWCHLRWATLQGALVHKGYNHDSGCMTLYEVK